MSVGLRITRTYSVGVQALSTMETIRYTPGKRFALGTCYVEGMWSICSLSFAPKAATRTPSQSSTCRTRLNRSWYRRWDILYQDTPIRVGWRKITTIYCTFRSFRHISTNHSSLDMFRFGDEADEQRGGLNTRTLVVDVSDLNETIVTGSYFGSTNAIDHNQYIMGNYTYQVCMFVFLSLSPFVNRQITVLVFESLRLLTLQMLS